MTPRGFCVLLHNYGRTLDSRFARSRSIGGEFGQAQWKAPADKKFTEARLKVFLETQKEWLEESAAIVRQATAAQTPEAKLASVAGIDKRFQACLDRHKISQGEYEWLSQRAAEAWGAVTYLDGELKSAQERLDAEAGRLEAAEAEERSRLAMFQEAKSNGWRVLSVQDREAAVKAALADQKTAEEEAKQHADDADAHEAEANQHDADAKLADEQAANPPADVSADDRSEYVQNKKNEARAARDSAKEVRNEEGDARKAQAEAQGAPTRRASGRRILKSRSRRMRRPQRCRTTTRGLRPPRSPSAPLRRKRRSWRSRRRN